MNDLKVVKENLAEAIYAADGVDNDTARKALLAWGTAALAIQALRQMGEA